MGHDDAADLLQETLDEEKAADEKLNELAEGGINEQAAQLAHPERDEEEEEEPVGAGARGGSSKRSSSSSRRR
jgi:hypothetical protein